MFIIAHCQQCNAAAEQNSNVENDIGFGHLLERCCIQTVQSTMEDSKCSHHADGLTVCRHVTVEVPCHGDGS